MSSWTPIVRLCASPGLTPSRFKLEPSATQSASDLKKSSGKETSNSATTNTTTAKTQELKSPGILVTNTNSSNRLLFSYFSVSSIS